MAGNEKRWAIWRILVLVGAALFVVGVGWKAVTPDHMDRHLGFDGAVRAMRNDSNASGMMMLGVFLAACGGMLHPALRTWMLGFARQSAAATAAGVKDGLAEPPSTAQRLAELDVLRVKGLVTPEEYDRKRASILDAL